MTLTKSANQKDFSQYTLSSFIIIIIKRRTPQADTFFLPTFSPQPQN